MYRNTYKNHEENIRIINKYLSPETIKRGLPYRWVCSMSREMNKVVELAQKLINNY